MEVAAPPGQTRSVSPNETAQGRFLDDLAALGKPVKFPAHARIITEGDDEDTLYLIREGRVRVFSTENDKQVVIDEHGAGRFVGEMALDGESRSASVEAIEPVSAVAIPREAVLAYLRANPDFSLTLIMTLIHRARRATENLKSVALRDVYGRVATLLQSLAEEEGGHRVVRNRITQLEIAQRVGASREMVSIVLGDLTEGGYLRKDQGRIVIVKPLPKAW